MPYDEVTLGQALVNAHKAGDGAAARTLAAEIVKLRGTSPAAPEPPKSALRDLGLGARDVAQGLGAIPAFAYDVAALPGNAVRSGYNKLTGNDGSGDISGMLGISADERLPRAEYSPSGGDLIKSGLDAIGLPEPVTKGERLSSALREGAASALGGVAGARALAGKVSSPTGELIRSAFAEAPVTQTVAGAGGAGSAEVVKESGGSRGQQLAAQLIAPIGIAGTLQAVAKGGIAVIENAAQRLRGMTTADRKVANVVRELGDGDLNKGIDIASQRLAENPDQALVDVLGMKGQKVARTATAVEGEGADIGVKFVEDRRAGRGTRLQGAADKLSPNNFREELDALDASKKATASPIYEEVFAPVSDKAGKVYVQWDDRLQQFLDEPIVREGMNHGIKTQQLEALAEGKPFNPSEYAVKGFDKDGNVIIGETANLRAMDAAKRGLDAQLEKYRNPITGKLVLDERGRAVNSVRRALISKLDEITTNPETGTSRYKEARDAWAGPSQLQDAMFLGRGFMRGDSEVTKKVFDALPASQKDAFKLGVRRELDNDLTRDTETAPGKFASKKADKWTRLNSIFSEDEVAAFRQGTESEAKKQEVERFVDPRAGSKTQGLGQDIKALQTVPDVVPEAAMAILQQNPAGLARALMSPFRSVMGPSKKTAEDQARIFFELDPAKQKQILRQLQGTPQVGPVAPIQPGNAKALAAALEAQAATNYSVNR